VAAILHGRRDKQAFRSRILTAAALTAVWPAGMFFPVMLVGTLDEAYVSIEMVIGTGLLFLVGFAATLPGALIIARLLERPSEEYRAFE
jgi:hypothetical protein